MTKAIDLEEGYWKNLKFNLLFIACFCVVYILVTKFMVKMPEFNNTDMLHTITDFEKIQAAKSGHFAKSQTIFTTIDTIRYDINQVQRIDEIKRHIANYKQPYKDNEFHSSYNFCLIGGNLLHIYLELNLEKSTIEKNNALIETNLNQCKANFKDEH
jgi:hypothetical protein